MNNDYFNFGDIDGDIMSQFGSISKSLLNETEESTPSQKEELSEDDQDVLDTIRNYRQQRKKINTTSEIASPEREVIEDPTDEDIQYLQTVTSNFSQLVNQPNIPNATSSTTVQSNQSKENKPTKTKKSPTTEPSNNEIVYNILADLRDKAHKTWTLETDQDGNWHWVEGVENLNIIKHNLDGTYTQYPEINIPEELGGGTFGGYTLSTLIDKLPHGIVDKKIPGIGATTLEIESKRNSIIIMPTKVLAYNKSTIHKNTLYIGGEIINKIDKTTSENINDYINNERVIYKKFLVVADNLGKLITILGEEVYNTYFLMVDEIDLLQADSSFRPTLENVIDYYFRFNIKNRCLISATINKFSNPLFDRECTFTINNVSNKKRNIRLLHAENFAVEESKETRSTTIINTIIKNEILTHPQEKILIAYNSVKEARKIIHLLEDNLKEECAILCSEFSKNEAGIYYNTLSDDFELSKRVIFITCCYFTGVDINDKYHLITVANKNIPYQTLSIDRMTQIYGRCRVEGGILSDTIIFHTIREFSLLFDEDMINYKDRLIEKAHKVISLYDLADTLPQGDKVLENLFEVIKQAIQSKAVEKLSREAPVELTRKNINGGYVPAYLNIDSLVEKRELDRGLYCNLESFKSALEKAGHTIIEINNVIIDKKEIDFAEENNYQEQLVLDSIRKTISSIKTLDNINDTLLQNTIKASKGKKRIFVERYLKLYHYIDSDTLIGLLEELIDSNNKAFRTINNAVMFWALDDEHSLKNDLNNAFIIGKTYTGDEIFEKIQNIVTYHSFKIIDKNTSVSFLRAYFETKRPKGSYKIIKTNPLDLTAYKNRIPKSERNLLKYFMFGN